MWAGLTLRCKYDVRKRNERFWPMRSDDSVTSGRHPAWITILRRDTVSVPSTKSMSIQSWPSNSPRSWIYDDVWRHSDAAASASWLNLVPGIRRRLTHRPAVLERVLAAVRDAGQVHQSRRIPTADEKPANVEPSASGMLVAS